MWWYFGKFEKIINSLIKIVVVKYVDGEYIKLEIEVLVCYLVDLNILFWVLVYKYYFVGYYFYVGVLIIDWIESGFLVYVELFQMVVDVMQVDWYLFSGLDVEMFKDQMVCSILLEWQVFIKL